MTEDELTAVASDAYDLTDTAQQALRVAFQSRGLNIIVKTAPPAPSVPEPDTDDEEASLEYDAQVEDEDDDEDEGVPEEGIEGDVLRCPKCHSEEVVFDSRESDGQIVAPEAAREDAKYDWRCETCGYQWQDDGIIEGEL